MVHVLKQELAHYIFTLANSKIFSESYNMIIIKYLHKVAKQAIDVVVK